MGHGHGHGHGHSHGPAVARAGERYRGRLAIAFVLAAIFLVVEVVVALSTDSLALLSDAGHMLTDTAGLGMALAAITAATNAQRPPRRRAKPGPAHNRTFGLYRLEVLAALVNAGLLFLVAGYVVWASIDRFQDPVEIDSGMVLAVGCAGLAVNLVGFFLLREGAKESLNVRGAYLEVLADALGSAAVIVAAILIGVTGEDWIDPALAIALGFWILPRTYRLGASALRVLLEAAPPHIDLTTLQADLAALPGVLDVHDLHVWTLTSEMEVATVHLVVVPGADTHAVLDQARHLLQVNHRLDHATLQVEPADHTGCEQVGW